MVHVGNAHRRITAFYAACQPDSLSSDENIAMIKLDSLATYRVHRDWKTAAENQENLTLKFT